MTGRDLASARSEDPRRVLLLGATGSIGRATAQALADRGHDVVAPVRKLSPELSSGVTQRVCDVTDVRSLADAGIKGERFDGLVSCLASRTGAPPDAWAIDHRAHSGALKVAREAGVSHMVLLSALCVQKPLLEFQRAKLAFEAELIASGLTYSIVRPTAFFKSLSGQIERLRQGKPYLLIGDGQLTACKPISDRDLADYIAGCLDDPARQDRILPIGGPGRAVTPKEQGEELFRLLNLKPKFRSVPVATLDAIVAGLSLAGRLSAKLAAKAELARIGRYYATQSMLVLNPSNGRYEDRMTPSHGRDTLFEHYARLVAGNAADDRGDHAVF